MSNLRPTLWRTCRAIANTTRLRLLWLVFENKGLCVAELAARAHISRQNATIQLRVLSSRGLITPYRKKMRVIYRAEENGEVEHATELLAALSVCREENVPFKEIFRQATAFTDVHRIKIARALADSPMSLDGLLSETGMVPSSLTYHLAKLASRGVVAKQANQYVLLNPEPPLIRCLVGILCGRRAGELTISKVISGGQTGADRAALDAAIACGIPHGGWCPHGRLSEEGPIPETYHLDETESDQYPVRTRMNVEQADVTLIFTCGPLSGGSLLTREFAIALRKPWAHIDLLDDPDIFQWLEKTVRKVPNIGNVVLNVAGSRASNDPKIYDAVFSAMVSLLRREKAFRACQPDFIAVDSRGNNGGDNF